MALKLLQAEGYVLVTGSPVEPGDSWAMRPERIGFKPSHVAISVLVFHLKKGHHVTWRFPAVPEVVSSKES